MESQTSAIQSTSAAATLPLTQKLILSFVVGFLGSAAYLSTLFFKFVGDEDNSRRVMLQPFQGRNIAITLFKCCLYCFIGGAVSTVFQYDVPNFVPIQDLILGVTWPAIISQHLSGRMKKPSQEELDNIKNDLAPTIKSSEAVNLRNEVVRLLELSAKKYKK